MTNDMNESKDKNREAIMDKFDTPQITLKSLKADLLDPTSQGQSTKNVEMIRDTNINISSLTKRALEIQYKEDVFFKPAGPFKISLEIIGTYKILKPEKIDEDEIENNLNHFAFPLILNASLIIGLLTDKMINIPITIPAHLTKGTLRASY